jgi:hypothetical protein
MDRKAAEEINTAILKKVITHTSPSLKNSENKMPCFSFLVGHNVTMAFKIKNLFL